MVLERTSEISDNKNLGEYDDMAMTAETFGDTLLVRGDVDLYVASEFRRAGEKHVEATAAPIIDLMGVPFLDSAGLAALLSIARMARSMDRSLRVKATGNPRRVLRITGIDRMVKVED